LLQLLAEDFSEFSMAAVASKAGRSRLTLYYQFESQTGLLEALYHHIARRGEMAHLAAGDGRSLLPDPSTYPPLASPQKPAIDTFHLLTSFETFDALVGPQRSRDEVIEIIRKLAHLAIGFTPGTVPDFI
jgi:AcrR family transcriptional regulator